MRHIRERDPRILEAGLLEEEEEEAWLLGTGFVAAAAGEGKF